MKQLTVIFSRNIKNNCLLEITPRNDLFAYITDNKCVSIYTNEYMPPKACKKRCREAKAESNFTIRKHMRSKSGQTGSGIGVGGVSKTKAKKINKCINNITKSVSDSAMSEMNNSMHSPGPNYPQYSMQGYPAGLPHTPISQFLPPPLTSCRSKTCYRGPRKC
jgi:hypothetical protein